MKYKLKLKLKPELSYNVGDGDHGEVGGGLRQV